jgi:uncharacterized protein YjiS (DUF1127 family)
MFKNNEDPMGTFLEAGMALRLPWRAACEAGLLLYRGVAGGWTRAGDGLSRMHARSRQRESLKHLDAHMLIDIGLSREAADREALRPFWLE